MKKELAITFGITESYVFALANVLIGMRNTCKKNWDDIIVYHDGVSIENQELLNKITPITFIHYNKDEYKKFLSSEGVEIYSIISISRYENFNLLKKYKKVIWHDVDILIQKDFIEVSNYGDKSGFAATINDLSLLVEANFNKLISGYDMFLPLMNSGILVFSDCLKDYDKMTDWCYSKLIELGKKSRYLDQGILNLLVQEFNIDIEVINISKFCCHPLRINSDDAVIIHAYGNEKFWNDENISNKFPLWEKNNNEWANICNNKLQTPLVSVIMSLYNRYIYFKEALESIINQTYKNIEIIIVLDVTENTPHILKIINDINDERVKVIKNKTKLGFAESLNVGISSAKGEFIARMDDDDVSVPERLFKQYEFLNQNKKIDIVGSYVELFMNKSQKIQCLTNPEKIKVYTLIGNQMFHPSIMMRREIIDKYKLYYDKNYYTEDAELWSRAVKYVKLSNIPEYLLKYRISGENETQIAMMKVIEADTKIIYKQLKENLHLDFTDEEIHLLSNRVTINHNIYNNKEIKKLKGKLVKKIIKANKKEKFYNEKLLLELFDYQRNNYITYYFKNMIKYIFRPLYNKLIYRIDIKIEEKINEKLAEMK
ncbi:MAG: glycosyltransferase [Romboutsia sp.]